MGWVFPPDEWPRRGRDHSTNERADEWDRISQVAITKTVLPSLCQKKHFPVAHLSHLLDFLCPLSTLASRKGISQRLVKRENIKLQAMRGAGTAGRQEREILGRGRRWCIRSDKKTPCSFVPQQGFR